MGRRPSSFLSNGAAAAASFLSFALLLSARPAAAAAAVVRSEEAAPAAEDLGGLDDARARSPKVSPRTNILVCTSISMYNGYEESMPFCPALTTDENLATLRRRMKNE